MATDRSLLTGLFKQHTHTHLLQVSSALSDKMSVVPLEDFNLKAIVVVHLEKGEGEGREGAWGGTGVEEGCLISVVHLHPTATVTLSQ